VRRVVLALALIAAVAVRARADEIKDIVVEDNKKTTSDTVILIAHIDVGDDWTPDMADIVKTRLVSSGLFSDVEVFWDAVPGGVRIHMLVHDKHSWVIAPAYYNQPTNRAIGVGYGENNLFGLNQKLLLYGQVAFPGDSFFVGAWQIPAIYGSHFYVDFDTYDKHSRNIEYANPTKYLQNPKAIRYSYIDYYNAGVRLGVEPLRGVRFDTRLRGAKVSYSHVRLDTEDNMNVTNADVGVADGEAVPAPGKEGWDVSQEFSFTYDRRANWYGVQDGTRLHFAYEHALPALGSDFHYWEINLEFFRAWQILERHDLVLKGHFDYGHQMPFQQEFETGGTSMRGWLNSQFRGDTQALANLEYSVPMFTVLGLSVRGMGFWDSAYTTVLNPSPERNYLPNYNVGGLDGFRNSVGVGTRLYLRQIVLPLLGLDVGYGLESGDVHVYLAIGLTD
jgi:outer membrane protein insertion porin family